MKQLLIHMDEAYTQAALMQNGELLDFFVERTEERSYVGNIYKGIVQNVLPGMQAAFIDIGLSKNAFLYVDDLLDPNNEKHSELKPAITDLLHQGQEIIVQVMKDPIGNKGARVTTHYNLAGRWLVYMPEADYIGVSKKVLVEEERDRLKQIGKSIVIDHEGVILRTAASGESVQSLQHDVDQLRELWHKVKHTATQVKGPYLLHAEEQLIQRIFRDLFTRDITEIWVNSEQLSKEVKLIVRMISPEHVIQIFVEKNNNFLKSMGVHRALATAFESKILLNSGGYIIWEETEALTVIDVNTGKYVGVDNLEETLFQTNAEAAQLIAKLLRLRDTGGIVIIDFIDMNLEENKNKIYKMLNQAVQQDGAKCVVFGWTRLGLMELTRKKTRGSFTRKFLIENELN